MEALYITSAQYQSPLSVLLTFNDKHTVLVDIGKFIQKHPHPQYNKYLEEKNFKKFKLEDGNIVCPNPLSWPWKLPKPTSP